jgi:signal peptidase I
MGTKAPVGSAPLLSRRSLHLAIMTALLAPRLASATEGDKNSYRVLGAGMLPTIAEDEYVFAEFYGDAAPERGDVAVFHATFSQGTPFVRRIIGIPGDRVQLKQGLIYLNSVVAGRRAVEVGETTGAREFVEVLGGRSYHILKDAGFPWRDDTAELAVPPGRYYVLGDNRDNAVDSRDEQIGLVARDTLIGRVQRIYWSPQCSRIGKIVE